MTGGMVQTRNRSMNRNYYVHPSYTVDVVTSTVKTGMASLFGQIQALSTGASKDELVKNALADYAAENFKVASFTALICAVQEQGDQQTASVCQQILQEDQAMADWIEQNLPTLVRQSMPQ